MSVYKYDENTQTMREYDIAYQVQGQECPDVPNTLENVTLHSSDAKLKVDTGWLPYFGIEEGMIKIGQTNNAATNFWNVVNDICLAPTDVPVGTSNEGWSSFNAAEQIYINNSLARWAGSFSEGQPVHTNNEKRSAFIDTHSGAVSRWLGNAYHDNCPIVVSYVPNGTAVYGGPLGTNQDVHIVCGNKITVGGIWENRQPNVIYYNENADFEGTTFADAGYTCQTISFDDSETQFLDNYFSISQDGKTLPWYTEEISNEYGKYIKLSKNETKLVEECIYSYENFVIPLEKNLTDTAVVRTGSYTKGDTTQTYNITLEPIKRTVKARMYFNPVEQDGKMFNNFCMWPFMANFGVSSEWNQLVQYMIKIRYKAVGSSTWTEMTLPTADELIQKSLQVAGYDWAYIIDMYTAEINTPGYYDVEWMYSDELYSLIDQWDTSQCRWTFTNRKMYYDYTNHTYEVKSNEDTYLENTPFVISLDYGKQYCDKVIGKHDFANEFTIRDWDDSYNPKMETLSIGPCTAQPNSTLFSGMMTRGLKYLVYNNIERGEGFYNWISCENWEDTFVNEGILFYVNPERQQFDDWILGCYPPPHVIYLHPDIYAMDNHGFDDTLTGWESWRYSDAGSPELRELPTNWRELVPNYIGE